MLAGLAAAVIGAAGLLVQRMALETVVIVLPDPDVDSYQRQFTCFEPYRGRSAEENANLAYEALLQHRARLEGAERPAVEDFPGVAAEALRSAEELLVMVEREYGCSQEVLR